MAAMEITLLICGIICLVVSFVFDFKDKAAEGEYVTADLTEAQKNKIREQINQIIDEELKDINEKTEASLDRISNTKILELNDYAENVLGQINKNHNETVFLYDMLNEKAKEVKNTVRDVNTAKKQKKEGVEAARERLVELDNRSNEKAKSTGEKKNQALELDKIVTANMDIQFEKGVNNNDKILELYGEGLSNKDIAKQLNLGIGEVKLVIDLYNGGK